MKRADRGVPRQGQGVRPHPQDGPHAAPGRGADDARPGVRGVRRDARGRGPGARADQQNVLCEVNMGATAIGTGLNAPAGYAAEVHRAPGGDHRLPDPPRAGPDRGDPGHAGLRPLLVLHEEPGHQAVEGLQRPAAALVGPALRACARSTCRPSSPAPRSCRARSTRSSPRSSTWSASGSSAATSPCRWRPRPGSSSSTSSSR